MAKQGRDHRVGALAPRMPWQVEAIIQTEYSKLDPEVNENFKLDA